MNNTEKQNLESLMKALGDYIKSLEKEVAELKTRIENATYIADSYQELFHLERKRNEELQRDLKWLDEILTERNKDER